MKKIYFVRHGETDFNAQHLNQDGTALLSKKGLKQADALAERLRHLSFDRLIVSDYTRTRQTVAPLLEHVSLVPEYTALVRETKRPSQFVGLSNKSPEYHAYLELSNTHIHKPDWHFADEENFYDIVARIRNFFDLINQYDGDTVVVSHGRFIIFVMMYVILNGELTPDDWLASMHGFATTNTGITVIGFTEDYNRWIVNTYNDHAHFAE